MLKTMILKSTYALYFGCTTSNTYSTRELLRTLNTLYLSTETIKLIGLVNCWYLRCGFIIKMCITFGIYVLGESNIVKIMSSVKRESYNWFMVYDWKIPCNGVAGNSFARILGSLHMILTSWKNAMKFWSGYSYNCLMS